jgi:hypothetical protein
VFDKEKDPTLVLAGICYTCEKYHEYTVPIDQMGHSMMEWGQKHLGHKIEFHSPKRFIPAKLDDSIFQEHNYTPWWLGEFSPNADLKTSYTASTGYTISPHSTPLASSSSLTLGRSSVAVNNSAANVLYLDYLIGGFSTTRTAPTAGRMELWAYSSFNDTPLYPDRISGIDEDLTLTSSDIKNAGMSFINLCVTDTTSARRYPFRATSLSSLFNSFAVPKYHGLFLTHNTVAALNPTGATHAFYYTPCYLSVA